MKFFVDTEFIEDGKTIDLISVGIVAEDGREFYAINRHHDAMKASEWVQTNVLAKLEPPSSGLWMSREQIRAGILNFVGPVNEAEQPEFWGYYADYDWVVFCQLFGKMIDLPKGWPMYCRDIKQLCDSLGGPKLPPEGKGEHNALADARWNQKAYEFLNGLNQPLQIPFDDDVQDILGRPCFTVAWIAKRLHQTGLYEVKPKAEAEQAAALHWMLGLYLKHGKRWMEEGNKLLKEFAQKSEVKATSPQWKSCAEWPQGTIACSDDATTDNHFTKEQAEAICTKLRTKGFGGDGKVFPVRTWVEEVKEKNTNAQP